MIFKFKDITDTERDVELIQDLQLGYTNLLNAMYPDDQNLNNVAIDMITDKV